MLGWLDSTSFQHYRFIYLLTTSVGSHCFVQNLQPCYAICKQLGIIYGQNSLLLWELFINKTLKCIILSSCLPRSCQKYDFGFIAISRYDLEMFISLEMKKKKCFSLYIHCCVLYFEDLFFDDQGGIKICVDWVLAVVCFV